MRRAWWPGGGADVSAPLGIGLPVAACCKSTRHPADDGLAHNAGVTSNMH